MVNNSKFDKIFHEINLKAKITIFYQSKNDLTPLVNGREIEKKIFPLLENIMLQYDTSLNSNPKNIKKIIMV